VAQECVAVFTEIKLKQKYRYVVYSLTDDLKQIHVLKTAPPSMYNQNSGVNNNKA